MTGNGSARGLASVLSVEERQCWPRIVLRIDEGEVGSRRPCELMCVAHGEVHEVDLLWEHESRRGEYMVHASPRREEARRLAVGDVVAWDLRHDEGRAVIHGVTLWDFLCLPTDLRFDAALPEPIELRLAHARGWALSPWFEGAELDSEESFRLELRTSGGAALRMGEPLAAAAYLESVRTVLHTLFDVRRGRLPSQITRLLALVDEHDPLSQLTPNEQARAIAVARTLATQTLQACVGARGA